jgi:scyllo-inositol 2-dehydrogenase (NADP+)
VNVAIVGYGLAGRVFHGPLIAVTPGMRVGAIVTANPQRQAEARRDFPEALVVTQAQAVWDAADRFDLAVIATASGSHADVAAAAIDAGIAVVVEKPMATSAAAAQSLTEHAAAREVLLVPFLNRRWDSDHLTLSGLLTAGRLGTVLRYESRFERWRPTPGSGWRDSRAAEMGGGLLLDLGTHLIDQALTLFGPVSEVYAEILARRGGSDDDVFLALRHDSGVLSHLWAGALAAAPGPRLRVLGDRGAYVITHLDGQEDALRAGRRPDQPAFADPPPDRWGRLLHGDDGEPVPSISGRWSEFYAGVRNALRDGAPPPVTAADAIAGLAIIEAARESARRRVLAVPIPTNA